MPTHHPYSAAASFTAMNLAVEATKHYQLAGAIGASLKSVGRAHRHVLLAETKKLNASSTQSLKFIETRGPSRLLEQEASRRLAENVMSMSRLSQVAAGNMGLGLAAQMLSRPDDGYITTAARLRAISASVKPPTPVSTVMMALSKKLQRDSMTLLPTGFDPIRPLMVGFPAPKIPLIFDRGSIQQALRMRTSAGSLQALTGGLSIERDLARLASVVDQLAERYEAAPVPYQEEAAEQVADDPIASEVLAEIRSVKWEGRIFFVVMLVLALHAEHDLEPIWAAVETLWRLATRFPS